MVKYLGPNFGNPLCIGFRNKNSDIDFPDKTVLKIFEGGIVYLAEDGENFFLIIDESTMASILDEEDLPDELVKIIEFDTEEERDKYIKSRGWD